MNTIVADRVAVSPARAPRWLLVAGLLGGTAAAAVGLHVAPDTGLPANAVARVNDHLILRDAWLRAVAAVASERRAPLTEADQRHILDRLIDEELLVQHGARLGLVESDARLRSTMVSEVMLAATNASAPTLDDAALRAFYDDHRDFFAPAAHLRVRAWRLGAHDARVPFEPPVPDVLLPVAKLRTYLGPTLAGRAQALAVGETSAPIEVEGSRVVLELLEAQPGAAPPFEQIRDQVRAEARRRADEDAVRALLVDLRRASRIKLDQGDGLLVRETE